jgi:hypothetical protein
MELSTVQEQDLLVGQVIARVIQLAHNAAQELIQWLAHLLAQIVGMANILLAQVQHHNQHV